MLGKIISLLPQELVVSLWRQVRKVGWVRSLAVWCVNTRFVAGVTGLIYSENGDLLIVKHTYKDIPWGVPSGALKHEHPFEGLKREVFEETGFAVEPLEILDVTCESKPSSLQIVVKAKLIGGLFKPSPEVSDFAFIRPPEGIEKLPLMQQNIIRRFSNG
jgi:8-oxo-dGTP pyrophosphatase MutT (NUDIX family)